MTYKGFKNLTSALLVGDIRLPADDESVKALLEMAFFLIASKTQVLRLLTLNKDQSILRTAEGDYLVRFPMLPEKDDDTLDIDHELCFAAARYVASFVTKDINRSRFHEDKGNDIIDLYTAKVDTIMQQIREEYDNGEYECLLPIGVKHA